MAGKKETDSSSSKSKAEKKKTPAKKKTVTKAAAKAKTPAAAKPAAKAKAPAKKSAARSVKFLLKAKAADWVSVVGSFNDWDPDKGGMKRGPDGIWTKTLSLKPGAYEYKFMVDGEWWADPDNPDFCYNEHGTTNSIVTVTG
jgi:1,4-alpha-glucan branching enzyme